jgi:hypothetical protein
LPKRQTTTAITQVAANSATIAKPRKPRSTFVANPQMPPLRSSFRASTDSNSIPPTNHATATDSPVTVML